LSLQNIAGIALHGLEHDNIAGECPEGEPFHLLKTIAQSQVKCIVVHYRKILQILIFVCIFKIQILLL